MKKRRINNKTIPNNNTIKKLRIALLLLAVVVIVLLAARKTPNEVSEVPVTEVPSVLPTVQPTLLPTEAQTQTTIEIPTDASANTSTEKPASENGYLAVHFLDVGQGDCTLIESEGEAMLIDCGPYYYGTQIQKYLRDCGIDRIKCLLLTHPDSDHIGSADVIITKYEIDSILMSPYTDGDSHAIEKLADALAYKNYSWSVPPEGGSFNIGDATVTILKSGLYEDPNNSSLACKISLGDIDFLFAGDSEEPSEDDMILRGKDLSAEVYHVSHHGSSSSTSERFLKKVNPKYAIISCGYENDYGHPHKRVMNLLKKNKIQIFRTDMQGTVVAWTDGQFLQFSIDPSEDYSPGIDLYSYKDYGTRGAVSSEAYETIETSEATEASDASEVPKMSEYDAFVDLILLDDIDTASPTDEPATSYLYIGNKNNMKLHSVNCPGKLPKEKNREYFTTLEEAVDAGYYQENQCQNCLPFEE